MPNSAAAIRTLSGRPRSDSPKPKDPERPDAPAAVAAATESAPESTADPAGDPWEAFAAAAARAAVRFARAADPTWMDRLSRAAADPAVRAAVAELAAAAAGLTGEEPVAAGPVEEEKDGPAPPPPEPAAPKLAVAAPPVAVPPPAPAAPAPPPVSLGEIESRLTLGASPPPAAAPTPTEAPDPNAAPVISEDIRDLPNVPARCRVKADALRWAADRTAFGSETGPLRERRAELEAAAAECGGTLWPLSEDPSGTLSEHGGGPAPADWKRAAAVFEVLAEAAAQLDAAHDRHAHHRRGPDDPGDTLDRLKQALDLAAEAQSMALVDVRRLRERPDRDQVSVYKAIRDVSDARTGIAYFIRDYLREGSHADPADHAGLAARLSAAASLRKREKVEQEGFKKFAHAAGKFAKAVGADGGDGGDTATMNVQATRLARYAKDLLADAHVPPSDVRFREAVADAVGKIDGPDAPRRLHAALHDAAARLGEADAFAEKGGDALGRVFDYLPEPPDADRLREDDADDAAGTEHVESVDAALARAAAEFPDALAYAFNSKSAHEDYPYQRPDQVYLGLKFLATTLREALAKRTPHPDLPGECRRQCGLRYSPNQSPTTMGQFPEGYRTVWRGEEVTLERHVGRGNNKDPRLSVRIAFHYDADEDRIVVGFLGQHQRTKAT